MATLEELLVRIEADVRGLKAGLDDAQKSVKGASGRMQDSLSGIDTLVTKRLIPALLAIGSVETLRGIASATVRFEGLQSALIAATGSSADARDAIEFVSSTANRLGINLVESANAFKGLAASARGTQLEGQATRDIFTAVAEASRVMGLSAENTGGVLNAIQQIVSKGVVSMEELRGQLGDRLPGALQIAARAMGTGTAEFGKMVEQGKVLSEDFLPKFAAELHKSVEKGIPTATESAGAAFERLGNSIEQLKVAIGRSGIVDFLADIAAKTTMIIDQATRLKEFTPVGLGDAMAAVNAELQKTPKGLADTQKRITDLRAALDDARKSAQAMAGMVGARVYEQRAKDLEAQITSLNFSLGILSTSQQELDREFEIAIAQEKANIEQYDRWEERLRSILDLTGASNEALNQQTQQFSDLQKALDAGRISADQYNDAITALTFGGPMAPSAAQLPIPFIPADAELQQQLSDLELTLSDSSERQLEEIQAGYMDRLFVVEQALDKEYQTNEQAAAKRIALAVMTEQAINNVKLEADRAKLTATGQLFGALAQLAQTGGKKNFEIYKRLAQAEALIAVYLAAQKVAAAVAAAGPIATGLAAAAELAAGLARLAIISQTTVGGGGAAPGAGAGGAAVIGTPIAPPIAAPTAVPQRATRVTINLGEEGALISKQAVRNLIERINEELDDGAVISGIAVS